MVEQPPEIRPESGRSGRTERRRTMRLRWRDGLSTLLVAAAVVLYALWLTGTAAAGMSTRVLGAVVLGLGWAACTSNQAELAVAYGAGGHRRAPWAYLVVASLVGLVALVAGVTTLVSASEAMLATLVAAMVTLWVVTTVRHVVAGQTRADGQRDPGNPWTGPRRRDVRT
jgi:hypothetical protein